MRNRTHSRPARPPVPRSRVAEPLRGSRLLAAALALLVAALLLGSLSARAQDAAPAATQSAPATGAAPASAPATEAAAAAAAPVAATPGQQPEAPADTRGIDEETQALKKDAVDLNRELFMLEEELLFPANTQVAVFVSMDVGEFFALDSVQLKVDDREVANYLYTEREAQALLKGGVHRVYLGNLKVGEHELVAIFTGKGPNQRDYRRGATVKFSKAVGAKYLELKITDRQRRAQPEFEIKDWE